VVCLSVSWSVTIVSLAKMAVLIEMLFWLWNPVGPRKHVLDGGAHWHHLVNTIKPSTVHVWRRCCLMSNYSDHLLSSFSSSVLSSSVAYLGRSLHLPSYLTVLPRPLTGGRGLLPFPKNLTPASGLRLRPFRPC